MPNWPTWASTASSGSSAEDPLRFLPDAPERLSRPTRDHPPAYHDMRLPETSAEIAAAIRSVAPEGMPFHTIANRYVALDAYRVRDGRRVIHLLNYRNDEPVPTVRVELGRGLSADGAQLFSPDGEETTLTVQSSGSFTVHNLQTYAVVSIA